MGIWVDDENTHIDTTAAEATQIERMGEHGSSVFSNNAWRSAKENNWGTQWACQTRGSRLFKHPVLQLYTTDSEMYHLHLHTLPPSPHHATSHRVRMVMLTCWLSQQGATSLLLRHQEAIAAAVVTVEEVTFLEFLKPQRTPAAALLFKGKRP